jgi:hypothetical protein
VSTFVPAPTNAPTLQRVDKLDISEFPSMAPSSKAPTGRNTVLTMQPTAKEDEMVYFSIQIDFFAGKERKPEDDEVESMVCQVNKFFENTLRDKINPSLNVFASNINWEFDDSAALPSIVEFFANVTNADGTHVDAEQVFSAMEGVDAKKMVQDYIWQSEPKEQNIFWQTEDIYFAGAYTGSANPPDPHPGKIDKVLNCV